VKILIVSLNNSPERVGIGKYTGEMSAWLANKGHSVNVISAPPYYPEWSIYGGYSALKYKTEKKGNLRVFRCPLWVPKKQSGLRRLLHLATFAVSSMPVTMSHVLWKPDIVICVEPPLFNSFSSLIASRMCGARCVLHIQDFEVDAAFELGLIKSSTFRGILHRVESFLLSRFDYVSTISRSMLDKLNFKQVPVEKRIYFPNWVDTDYIKPQVHSKLRDELNICEDETVVLYSGNIGEKQGLEVVVEAAICLGKSSFKFVFCGSGSARTRLQRLTLHLQNIIWLDLQPYEKLNDLLNMADIHLLPQRADAADLVMPSKLTGMLASGRSIAATASRGTEIFKVLHGMAEISEPGDVDGLVASIRKLASDAELRSKYGKLCREYAVNNLSQDSIMTKFLEDISKIKKQ